MPHVNRRLGVFETRWLRRAWPLLALAAGWLLLLPALMLAEDWMQFRGANGNGVCRSSESLPAEFSQEQNVRWSAPLGDGIGSPVIAGGKVYATAMAGPQQFKVFCFEAATGKSLWTREFETGPLPTIMPPNSQASSTPATDGRNLYVYFSTLGILALDGNDGTELWRAPVEQPFYLMAWGAASSPIVYGDLVIFNQDDDLHPVLYAFDKQTGKLRWRTERPDMLAGYALPVICTAGGRTDIVVAGTGKLKGYDPATGKELWTCNTLLRTIMTTPVVHNDLIYVSVQSYGDADRMLKDALLEWKDTNQDAKLSKSEIPEAFWKKFDLGDANKDGFLEGKEIDAAFQSPQNMAGGGSIIQAIRGGGTGDVTKTHVHWSLENKASSNIASPLVVSDRLFVVKQGGISSCFDAQTGKTQWMLKRLGNLGNYYASPIAADGKIYVTGENGFIVVLADSPQLEILAKNDMGENCVATPAIADGKLFVRTKEKLYCIANPAN
jgi:outer membrane protein assembly factor BamB